jgi:dCTP deaminase
MSVKCDKWIRKMSIEHKMIEPYEDRQVRDGVISYGVSSYGYDMRVADEFRIFTNVNSTIVDPKCFDDKSFVEFKGARWNTSAFPGRYCRSARANRRTPAAESS